MLGDAMRYDRRSGRLLATHQRQGRSLQPRGSASGALMVTVLDHFTSSFHWAETNFSAIWLRPHWYLVDNLVLTDVQDGGISFITSGDYARASVIDGDWAVMRTSILIGHTQAQ